MRRLFSLIFIFFCLSANAQWTEVPSGTDSALYCVSSNDEHYFVGGATGMLLKSSKENIEFLNIQEEYDTEWEYYPGSLGITKIGIINDSTLFFQNNAPIHEVADSVTVYTFWSGVSVHVDSNLVIMPEQRAEVVVDTSMIQYVTDPEFLYEEGAVANVGTTSWVLSSNDAGESYESGTALNMNTYINSTYVTDSEEVGLVDYDGHAHISTNAGNTFNEYQLPGWPFDYENYQDFFRFPAGFCFNSDLIGFYAPVVEASSSIYKVDLNTGNSESCDISTDHRWFRIEMQGNFVIAVGDSGMVASSFDQGETWTVENIGTELNLYGVDVDEEGNLIIVGDSGLIMTNSIPPVEGIEISSEDDLNVIETESGTLQLNASVFPASAPQEVSWSMVNLSGTATIDQNGLVTAQGNGLVMAVASLPEPPGITGLSEMKTLASPTANFFIQISGQELGEQYIFGADTTICGSDVFTVSLADSQADVEWSDGSTDTSLEISQFGTYWVTLTDGDFVRSDTIRVFQWSYPEFSLGDDINACNGDEIMLEAPIPFSSYEWSTGSEENSISVNESGVYSLGITVNNCTSYDEIQVDFLGVGDFDLGDDISICDGETTTINAPLEGNYLWSTGSEDSDVLIDTEGWVVLEIAEDECSDRDSLFVTVDPTPEFELGADTTICDTASLLLDATVSGGLYEWSTGSNEPTLEVEEEGFYEVVVTLGNCTASDGIQVSIQNCTLSAVEQLSRKTKVYPNPADEFIVIEIPSKLFGSQVSLYGTDGKKIFSQNQNSLRESYSLNQFSKGTYILIFELDEIQFSREIIKN